MAEGLLDGIRVSDEAGQGQLRRQHAGETAHSSGHVQRGGPRHGAGVARCEDEGGADPKGEARLFARQAAEPGSGGHRAQERRLAVLVGERPGGHRRAHPGGHFISEDQRGQRLLARPSEPLGTGQRGRQDLNGALTRDVAMPLAQLDRAPGEAVEQRRRARVGRRPARRIDGRAPAPGLGQSRPRRGHLGLPSNPPASRPPCRAARAWRAPEASPGIASHGVSATKCASSSIAFPIVISGLDAGVWWAG